MVLEAPGAADTAKPAAAAAPDRAAVAPDPDPTPDRAEPAEPAPPEVAPTPITTPPATAGQLSPVPVTPTAPGARRVPHAGAPGAGADGDSDASEDDTPRKVSDVELELRLLALASCQLGPQGIDPKCEAMVQYKAGRTSDRMLAAFNQGARDIGLRHLGNPSPSVRLQALQLVGSLHKASPEFLQPVIDAALREPETYLAVQLLRRLGSSIGRDPKVLELMFTQSRHEVPEVRMEASLWLLSAWARDTEGSLERGLELAEKDPVRRVRRMACRRLGERADERALPLLRKLTDGPGNDPELYAACFTGLVGMWAYPTVHDPPSQKAYELTLKRLQAVPRTKESPPWSALSGLQWSKTEAFRERAPWFDPKGFEAILERIANDRGASWEARNGCIDVLVEVGAPDERFKRLYEAYKGVSREDGDDRNVLGKIESVLGMEPPGERLPLPKLAIPGDDGLLPEPTPGSVP